MFTGRNEIIIILFPTPGSIVVLLLHRSGGSGGVVAVAFNGGAS